MGFRLTALTALLLWTAACFANPSRHSPTGPRLVSLAPSLTEILFALGAGEEIVGVTLHCRYPPEAQMKETIGDFLHPNLEKIVALEPTLVVAERWPSSKTVRRLRAFGLNVFEFPSPRSLDGIYDLIGQVGNLVDRERQAGQLVEEMRQRVQKIQARAHLLQRRPSVYVEIDLPSWTIGKTSFITEALHLIGARNLFEDVEKPALQASDEVILARDPEIILSFTRSAGELARRPGWEQIRALRQGSVIDDFDQSLLSHGNHRLVEAMERLQARLLELEDED